MGAKKEAKHTTRIPLLAMRGMVLFPQMVLHFDVGREKSILALNEAMNHDRMLFLSAQTDIRDEDPTGEQIYRVGVVAEIKQIIKSQDHLRVLVAGGYRARLVEFVEDEPHFVATVEEYPTKTYRNVSGTILDALMRLSKNPLAEICPL